VPGLQWPLVAGLNENALHHDLRSSSTPSVDRTLLRAA
jgi:hypothetical protein